MMVHDVIVTRHSWRRPLVDDVTSTRRHPWLPVLLCCVVCVPSCLAVSYDELNSLRTDLLTGYNTKLRPVLDQASVVNVQSSVFLLSLSGQYEKYRI